MKIANKAVKKYGVSIKQAKVLACIENEEIVSTEEIADRLKLQYQDARNQIKALTELGLMDVFDQKGKRLLYGLTSNGISVINEMLRPQLSTAPQGVESKVEVNGHSRREESLEMFASEASVEKAGEVCVLLIGLQEFASFIQQAVTQPCAHA